jgi:NAD-dependent dihydropyrimidine dehydrogenase PreA subunit
MGKIVTIDEELCIGCGACADMCPQKILYVDEASGKCKVTDESKCDRRRGCEGVCPSVAIKILAKGA